MSPNPKRETGQAEGFTFLEVLLSIMIVSVLSVSIYATFAQSLKLWSRTSKLHTDFAAEIFFEKITGDLRNALGFSGQTLRGWEDSLEFFSLSRRQTEGSISSPEGFLPIKIRYSFNGSRKELNRSTIDYRDILYRKTTTEYFPRAVAEKVRQCRFEYYTVDPVKKSAVWNSFWQGDGFPKAVRISLSLDDNQRTRHVRRIIPIPAGGG